MDHCSYKISKRFVLRWLGSLFPRYFSNLISCQQNKLKKSQYDDELLNTIDLQTWTEKSSMLVFIWNGQENQLILVHFGHVIPLKVRLLHSGFIAFTTLKRHCGICIVFEKHLLEPPTMFMHFKCIWMHWHTEDCSCLLSLQAPWIDVAEPSTPLKIPIS